MSEESLTLTCTFHPKRETKLRCNRCNRPICVKCVQQTPTGYRCPECIRTQQKAFITARWYDYLTGVVITGLFSFLGSLLAGRLGFLTIFIAPLAGTLTEGAVRKLVSNRRSPLLYKVVGLTAFIACLPVIILEALTAVSAYMRFGWGAAGRIFPLIWVLVYAVMVTSTIYYRFTS